MAVRIRLARFGRRHHPIYRIVVMDSRSPREGNYIDILGAYDPKRKEVIEIKGDRVREWVARGAEIAGRAKVVLESAGVLAEAVPPGYELKKTGDYWVLKKKTTKEVRS